MFIAGNINLINALFVQSHSVGELIVSLSLAFDGTRSIFTRYTH